MKVKIEPSSPKGTVAAPPSKSDAHRLLMCAGLSSGESRIENIAFSDDIKATLGCLEALGAEITARESAVIIKGAGEKIKSRGGELFCNECGTTIRFMLPICLLSGMEYTVRGSERLLKRPLSVYEDICSAQGIYFANDGSKITLRGKLRAGEYEVKGNISSQFISGLLFALPLLESDSTIKILPPFESRPYVDMTLSVLSGSGIKIIKQDDLTFEIPGGQSYRPSDAAVEGDWSNAAFFEALKALGNDVEVSGLRAGSLQGDRNCVRFFEMLKEDKAEINLSDCPDLAPILFTFAGMNKGAVFTGTERLKIKESDRVGEMARELKKAGIELTDGGNTVEVYPGYGKPTEAFDGHNDHRIVMALSVLMTKTGGEINGAEAVKKSYPDFFEDLRKTGVVLSYGT